MTIITVTTGGTVPVRTIEFLTDPVLRGYYWPGVLAGLAVAALAAPLSVLVVLRRLAFIGQGVSHAAFGGVGVALALGAVGMTAAAVEPGRTGIILAFCVLSAYAIAWLGERSRVARPDTAIGIVLVASMAIGFVLHRYAAERARAGGQPAPPGLEDVLFGGVLGVGWFDAGVAGAVAVGVLVTLAWVRRDLVFWAFEPTAAEAFGVAVARVRNLVMILLAVAIVVGMQLAGVVLVTAMLVLPGAIALRLSARLWGVLAWAWASAILGVGAGLVLSFELDQQPGPMIVLAMTVMFGAASVAGGRLCGRKAIGTRH